MFNHLTRMAELINGHLSEELYEFFKHNRKKPIILKELVLSGSEDIESYMLIQPDYSFKIMEMNDYLNKADKEIEIWFLQKDETAPDGARIVIKLKEE